MALFDVRHVLRTMPAMSIYALAVFVVVMLLAPVADYSAQHLVRDLSWELGRGLAEAALLTPFYIAVHRLLILDEAPDADSFHPGTNRFWRFFAASCVLAALYWLALLPAAFFNSFGWWSAAFIVSMAASLMLMLWFPAIAVDSAETDIASAFRRSRKHFFRLLAAFWMVATPIWAVFIIGSALIPLGPLLAPVCLFLTWTACISLASRAWQWQAAKDVGKGPKWDQRRGLHQIAREP